MSLPFDPTMCGDKCHPQTPQPEAAVSRELIRLENITKTYHLGQADVSALRGVSLTIARGEMVALMGASGSGKTTLMNILGCLDRPSSGRFWFEGREMGRLSPTGGPWCGRQDWASSSRVSISCRGHRPCTTSSCRWTTPCGGRPAARRAPGRVAARASRASRARAARAFATLRRPAAARGHRPGPGQSPRTAPGRRTDGQPRFADRGGDPADVAAAERPGCHGRSRDSRRQSRRLRRSHDPACRRADCGRFGPVSTAD